MEDLIIRDEEARKLLDKAGKITFTDYTEYTVGCLVSAIEDMIDAYEEKEDELERLEQDIEDNYKPISAAEAIGFDEMDLF